MEITGLSSTDRVLGMVFGLLRGVIVVVFAIALLRVTPASQSGWWQQSVMIDKLGLVEQWSRRVLGDDIDRFLPAQPHVLPADGYG